MKYQFLFVIFSGFLILLINGKLTEIAAVESDKLGELIHLHRKEIKNFLETKNINLIGDKNDPVLEEIFGKLSKEFPQEFSFSLLSENSVSTKTRDKFFWRFEEMEREGFVFHWKGATELKDEIEEMVYGRNGYYLIIVSGENSTQSGDEVVEEFFRRMWKKIGSLTMVAIYKEKLWRYNPYTPKGNKTYGALELFQQRPEWKEELLSNMNQYPLIVEIFESGFNIGHYEEINGKKVFQYFVGPDGVTVDILRKKMNFTGESVEICKFIFNCFHTLFCKFYYCEFFHIVK